MTTTDAVCPCLVTANRVVRNTAIRQDHSFANLRQPQAHGLLAWAGLSALMSGSRTSKLCRSVLFPAPYQPPALNSPRPTSFNQIENSRFLQQTSRYRGGPASLTPGPTPSVLWAACSPSTPQVIFTYDTKYLNYSNHYKVIVGITNSVPPCRIVSASSHALLALIDLL